MSISLRCQGLGEFMHLDVGANVRAGRAGTIRRGIARAYRAVCASRGILTRQSSVFCNDLEPLTPLITQVLVAFPGWRAGRSGGTSPHLVA